MWEMLRIKNIDIISDKRFRPQGRNLAAVRSEPPEPWGEQLYNGPCLLCGCEIQRTARNNQVGIRAIENESRTV